MPKKGNFILYNLSLIFILKFLPDIKLERVYCDPLKSVLMVHPTGVPHATMLKSAMPRSTVRRRLEFHCSR